MQDAFGGTAIHAALRSLTSTCSAGLLNCGIESAPSEYNVRFGDQAHFFPGSLGRFAHKMLRGECVTETRSS
jgi:hypothetical protein